MAAAAQQSILLHGFPQRVNVNATHSMLAQVTMTALVATAPGSIDHFPTATIATRLEQFPCVLLAKDHANHCR